MAFEAPHGSTQRGHRILDRILRHLSSIRTGIILLILVGIASAAGTLILQRPLTSAADLRRAYSPETLQWLDRLGLTDVFHTWWFVALLALLSVNIVLASLERLPVVWRFFSKPYRRPDPHFVASLPVQRQIPIRSEASALDSAERVMRRLGFKPQRVVKDNSISLYAERNRFARLAAYVVHTSLLLIFAGGIADALWGYRGYMGLTRGEQSNQIEMNEGVKKTLPFSVRCEAAGQENYPDGSPRRWWSKLTVIEDQREVAQKEIEVNDPLVHRGLRFFQSSYGPTGEVDSVRLVAVPKSTQAGPVREIILRPGKATSLDPETTVELAALVPDFVVVDNQIRSRSDQMNNPALQLVVNSKKSGETKVWLFARFPDFQHADQSPYTFQFRDVEMGYFTGLQVSYEPGQWAVWGGVVLMGLGLTMAFYFIHVRVWAMPLNDGRGRLVLWVGASASKNREEFAVNFNKLVNEIQDALEHNHSARTSEDEAVKTALPAGDTVRTRV